MQRSLYRFIPLLLLSFLFVSCTENLTNNNSQPSIVNFVPSPERVSPGSDVTLSWTVNNATTITIDNGIGDVTADTDNQVTVNPVVDTTYILTATNVQGDVTAQTQVEMIGNTGNTGDTADPTGSFGVSDSQNGPFEDDQPGGIDGPNDSRIVTVAPGGTFYAQVAYSDPSGISNIDINLVNSAPPGLKGELDPTQGPFTLGNAVGGCDLSSNPISVTCVYPINVAANAQSITELADSGSEFAYVFRTQVTDTAGNISDEAKRGYVIIEEDSNNGGNGDQNSAPTVSIADVSDLTLDNGSATASLNTTVTDPESDIFDYQWSVSNGEASNVSFTSATSEDTNVTFSAAGSYTLELTATDINDANSTGSATVAVTVKADGGDENQNTAPTVNVGTDQEITLPDDSVDLNGTVDDDGLPDGSSVTTTWSKESGAGTVTFGDASSVSTTATFSEADTYVLTLTATDGDETSSDNVTVVVNPASPEPTVSIASASQDNPELSDGEVTLELTATASNFDSDALAYTWSSTSDDSSTDATFDPNGSTEAASTTATFTEVGTYEVKVTANSDSEAATVSASVTVEPGPTADAGTDQTVELDDEVTLDGSGSSDPDGNTLTSTSTTH